MGYELGATVGTMVTAVTLCGTDPQATYSPGAERVTTVAGTLVDVGFPRVTWTFAALTVAQWGALGTLIGGAAGVIYIQTRDDVDDWATYEVIARLPDPGTLTRWGGVYRDVTVEFVLLEAVA